MRAQSVNFERGQDPKTAMDIGYTEKRILSKFLKDAMNIIRDTRINNSDNDGNSSKLQDILDLVNPKIALIDDLESILNWLDRWQQGWEAEEVIQVVEDWIDEVAKQNDIKDI